MKFLNLLLFVLPLFFISCGNDNDEPLPNKNRLVGYWAITHIKTIEHIGGVHNTTDKDVPPHGVDSYVSEYNYRYDVLIFDEELVTVRGDMPNRPKQCEYEDTPDEMIEYIEALENWDNNIGKFTDDFSFPVGEYSIKNGDLIIGSLNMGTINFISNDEFTLDYKKTFNNNGDYKRLIYTYSRIYSLTI